MTRVANNRIVYTSSVLAVLVLFIFFAPFIVAAQGYISLVGIDGARTAAGFDTQEYIDTLYRIAIIAAAFVAVGKLVWAGAQYVLSGVVTKKEDAKKEIWGALIGILIILGAVTILTTINPQISNLRALNPIDVPPPPEPEPEENSVEHWCDQYGQDNCSVKSCDMLGTDYWLTWLVNEPLNRVSCSTLCAYYDGNVVGRDMLNTGSCVYPTDHSAYVQQQAEEVTEQIAEELGREIPPGTLAARCAVQGGPTQCQSDREACTSGNILPEGVRGIASNPLTTEGGVKIIMCSPPSQ